jgi:DNA polymerase-3 subunit delta'
VGKTTLARAFAQALLCKRPSAPCGTCRACRLVMADRHPDVSLVAPEDGTIRIESIRDLQQTLSLAPVEGAHRVCIVRQIDLATPSAANCLLKTLEEPPPRVILVLTASSLESLLPTLVSRCQALSLRAVPTEQIVAALQERGVERAQLLGALAQGRVGWAIEASRDKQVLARREQVLEKVLSLDGSSYQARFTWAEELSKAPERIPETLQVLSSWWRDVLILASGSGVQIANQDRLSVLQEWAARHGVDSARRVLLGILDTMWRLARNANRRLALEVLMMDLPGRR